MLVIEASPGSGKTTRVPPALLKARFRGDREIWILEPRRLAAKWAARRVADELGQAIGRTVGYQFRFENVGGPETRLRFLTEGMLIRRLIGNPNLKGVAAVILDEFHERHLHGDVALGYLNWLRQNARPDLRIAVMSATLDSASIASFLAGASGVAGSAPALKVEAQRFPIKLEYLPAAESKYLEVAVREATESVLDEPEYPGDILVFLPGMAEIRRTAEELSILANRKNLLVLPLHGDLSREEQDRAMQKADRRKVILATNIAETSLTIEGVTAVIDGGLHRVASYSWWSGIPSLRTKPISKASATQRMGRAGRTAPGLCIRLYSRGDFDGRAPFEVPEIARADLAQTILELKTLGVKDVSSFPWFEAPPQQSIEGANRVLFRLGALDEESATARLTPLGEKMVRIPAHPRISKLMLEAHDRGVLGDAATLGALIAEGSLDSLDALSALKQPLEFSVRKFRTQLLESFQWRSANSDKDPDPANVAKSLLAAFPDRVAQKRTLPAHSGRGNRADLELRFCGGGSAKLENSASVSGDEMFVVLDVQERKFQNQLRPELKVHSLCPIQPEWLFDLAPSLIREEEELLWDPEREQVSAREKLKYDHLVLSESTASPHDSESALRLLLKAGLKLDCNSPIGLRAWLEALGRFIDRESLESFFARIALYARYDQKISDAQDSAVLWRAIRPLLENKRSIAELKEIDWFSELAFQWEQISGVAGFSHQLDRQLPLVVALASGRKAKIHYRLDIAPWVESRLQDFFGMKQPPQLLGGKVPLTIHLLAPNQRAVQVTSDLGGFWERAYPSIRKELCRRYPRHAWPEDPTKPLPPKSRS